MKWADVLLKKCNHVLVRGGEVRVQFSKRKKGTDVVSVPIIRAYPDSQTICDEVLVIDDE